MEYGIFVRPVCTIYDLPAPTRRDAEGAELSAIGDEGLCGQSCRVLAGPGGLDAQGRPLPGEMAEILTFYGYHGYVYARDLRFVTREELEEYLASPRRMVCRACDVLSLPRAAAVRLAELEAGAVVRLLPEPEQLPAGWALAALPDGRRGFVRDVALAPVRWEERAVFTQRPGLPFTEALALALGCAPAQLLPRVLDRWYGGSAAAFRRAVMETARRYLGTEYRWGGKSGRGVDCSGLVSGAYMQCGVLIYRDAKLAEGWPMHKIPFEAKQPGDALYFPGHIALYLGQGRYIHSTGAAASGGVVLNSLEESDPLFRPDLAQSLYAVGSIF